jgi:hypothetical protein
VTASHGGPLLITTCDEFPEQGVGLILIYPSQVMAVSHPIISPGLTTLVLPLYNFLKQTNTYGFEEERIWRV